MPINALIMSIDALVMSINALVIHATYYTTIFLSNV